MNNESSVLSVKSVSKSFEGKKIEAIDTGAACACSAMILEEMLELANSGKTFEEISKIIVKTETFSSVEK